MIPDKIYVPQHNIEAGNIQELDELVVAGSIEYTRKDYLLELIEEEEKFWDDGEMIFRKLKKELNEI